MGLSFITEGAIPFAAADPLRVIPSMMVGSGVAGAIALGLGSQLTHHMVVLSSILATDFSHVFTNYTCISCRYVSFSTIIRFLKTQSY